MLQPIHAQVLSVSPFVIRAPYLRTFIHLAETRVFFSRAWVRDGRDTPLAKSTVIFIGRSSRPPLPLSMNMSIHSHIHHPAATLKAAQKVH